MSRLRFKLRFADGQVGKWAGRYDAVLDTRVEEIGRQGRDRGYLSHDELRVLGHWKTPRSAPRIARNDPEFVRETTRVALGTASERLRIEALTLLEGVEWPTASVILHFAHPEPYPILDYRALWSLGVSPPPRYGFEMWQAYVAFTRSTAHRLGVSMRDLDRALWQFSKERQG
jgi:hypothetical protein